MALILSIDGPGRLIYLDPLAAISDEIAFHPVDDLYAEYRAYRRVNESLRSFAPLMLAAGNVPKGSGKYTPRYTMLLGGTKVVIPDGVARIRVLGELLTDDQTDQFDVSQVTSAVTILYQPSDAEVIKVNTTGGSDELTLTADQLNAIASKVWQTKPADPVIPTPPTTQQIADAVWEYSG